MFVKLSILMLYLRLFGVNKKFRIACYSIMALVVGYLVASTLAYIFGCSPLDKTWNISIEGTCIDDVSLDFAIGGLSVLTDTLIFILPLPMVWRLHVSMSHKIALVAVFATGSLCNSLHLRLSRYIY